MSSSFITKQRTRGINNSFGWSLILLKTICFSLSLFLFTACYLILYRIPYTIDAGHYKSKISDGQPFISGRRKVEWEGRGGRRFKVDNLLHKYTVFKKCPQVSCSVTCLCSGVSPQSIVKLIDLMIKITAQPAFAWFYVLDSSFTHYNYFHSCFRYNRTYVTPFQMHILPSYIYMTTSYFCFIWYLSSVFELLLSHCLVIPHH